MSNTGALLVIGGGAFVLSKIDPGFNEFMGSTSAKVSICGKSTTVAGPGLQEALQSC